MSGGAPSLPEEILLLLLDDATGRPVAAAVTQALEGRLALDEAP